MAFERTTTTMKRDSRRKKAPSQQADPDVPATGSLFEIPSVEETTDEASLEPSNAQPEVAGLGPTDTTSTSFDPALDLSPVHLSVAGLPAVVAISSTPNAVLIQHEPSNNPDSVPPAPLDPSGELQDYVIQTSQEVDALMRAASDGRMGDHWVTDENSATRSHAVPGAPHHVQIALSEDERASGVPLKVLEDLTLAQDPDFNFALLYVSQVLAPPSPLPPDLASIKWIDLDDVMDKIGWDPRSTKERLEMRRRVWRYLLFGARASIVGQRNGEYVDRKTGQRIETIIDSPPWAVLEREKPAQPKLFPEIQETPLRVRLVASQAWTRLTTLPETAQYLPMGELLGAIPGNKPSGAWARVLGLSLANFWRRQPRAALDQHLKPTRRELLDRYTPKAAPPSEILKSRDPRRAIEYWHGALQILVECGFLAREGEATLSSDAMRQRLPRQEWQEQWLRETVELRPGAKMQGAVQSCAQALPFAKPLVLGTPSTKRKRGRPRKKPATTEDP